MVCTIYCVHTILRYIDRLIKTGSPGAYDHVVFLDGGEPIDPMVIRVGLVILCTQARGFVQAQLFQGQDAQVAVQQRELGLLGIGVQVQRLLVSNQLSQRLSTAGGQ